MSTFSDETAAVALESITEFGEVGTFTRITKGEYSTTNLSHSNNSETTFSVYVLIYDFDLKEKDGETVLTTDKQCLCPTTDTSSDAFAPVVGDKLTAADGKEFRVNEISDPVKVNGESVLYILKIGI